MNGLPDSIRPVPLPEQALKSAKDARWIKRQRLVLTLRYHNIRLLLFGSILLRIPASERAAMTRCQRGVDCCLESARETINVIYQAYQHTEFFRTWFHNTTYTNFAASLLLIYIKQADDESDI